MISTNSSYKYCSISETVKLVDNLITTLILSLFFLIGSCTNLLLVSTHYQRRKKKSFRSSAINRSKNQVNNLAIYLLSIVNLILSLIFVPYTIFFRVWQFNISPFAIKIMEHLKDSLIYMNLFIISVISLERYFAVCKPQYYKTLESNINKIIWIVYLFFLCFSASNYLTDIKLDSNCTSEKFLASNLIDRKFSIKKLLNYLNVFLSTFFFISTAIISSSFYCKITYHQSRFSFYAKNQFIASKKLKQKEKMCENFIDDPDMNNSCNSLAKNQSSVSVQTDFNETIEIKTQQKFFRQRSSSTKALTKISILVR